jgi:hypothetical protein
MIFNACSKVDLTNRPRHNSGKDVIKEKTIAENNVFILIKCAENKSYIYRK